MGVALEFLVPWLTERAHYRIAFSMSMPYHLLGKVDFTCKLFASLFVPKAPSQLIKA